MKKYLTTKNFSILLLNLLFLLPLCVYGRHHLTGDSYGIMLEGAQSHVRAFIAALRFFGALVYKLLSLIGHNPLLSPVTDIIIFILLVTFSVTAVTISIYNTLEKKNVFSLCLIDLTVLLTIENVWFCNLLLFPECITLTAVGISLCFGAVIIFFSLKTPWRYIISSLLIVLSTAIYQQFITVFAIYVIAITGIIVSKKTDISIKLLFFTYIKPVALIIISGAIYFVTGKMLIKAFHLTANGRVAFNIGNIIENTKYFISHQHSFLKGRGYFNSELLTMSFLLFGLVWFICVFTDWLTTKNYFRTIALVASYFAGYAVSYLLGLISTSHSIRTVFGLFSVFAMFSIGVIALTNKKTPVLILLTISLILIPANITKIINESNKQIEENIVEQTYIKEVCDWLDNYEQKTGNQVNAIGYCYDISNNIDSENVYIDYAFEAMLSLENESRGKNEISFTDIPESVIEKFNKAENMTEFNAEKQIVFDNNNAYICIY